MTAKIHQQMTFSDWVILIILSILWGGSFFFIEVLVEHLPPLTIVNARVALAAIALWIIILARKVPIPKTRKVWLSLVIIGLINNALPFSLITWGQTQINSGLASIFNAMAPFFTVLVAGALLSDERITPRKIFGVVTGLIGAIILIGPEALNGLTGPALGQLAVISAAFSYALAAVYARRFKEWGLSPLLIATGQVTMAAIMLLPLTLWFEQPWTAPVPSAPVIAALLGLAFFSTVIAYILYFRLIESAGATNAALVTFLIPISAIVLGVTFLDEVFTPLQILGMAVIFTGLIIMDGRLDGWLKARARKA